MEENNPREEGVERRRKRMGKKEGKEIEKRRGEKERKKEENIEK